MGARLNGPAAWIGRRARRIRRRLAARLSAPAAPADLVVTASQNHRRAAGQQPRPRLATHASYSFQALPRLRPPRPGGGARKYRGSPSADTPLLPCGCSHDVTTIAVITGAPATRSTLNSRARRRAERQGDSSRHGRRVDGVLGDARCIGGPIDARQVGGCSRRTPARPGRRRADRSPVRSASFRAADPCAHDRDRGQFGSGRRGGSHWSVRARQLASVAASTAFV